MTSQLADIFPLCRSLLGPGEWQRLMKGAGGGLRADALPDLLGRRDRRVSPRFLSALARIELARSVAGTTDVRLPAGAARLLLNPSLQLVSLDWTGLARLFTSSGRRSLSRVRPGDEIVMIWREPVRGEVCTRAAEAGDLLAVKLVVEEIAPGDAAREAGVAVGNIDAVLREAVQNGILLSPASRLRREPEIADNAPEGRFAAASVFTLQWHLTQECDLHCRHCYDRSRRREFPFERAVSLLDELRAFCCERFVRGQVSLSGGNPLLYPQFLDLYRAAAERDFMIAILGNATDRVTMERIMEIRTPAYYQVSLEGLERHNDEIRGTGNFRRTKEFLRMLTVMGVPNMVMLTLTRDNIGQVIPLAEELEGITGGLTFNRLAQFGEGADLQLPTMEAYRSFLEEYAAALETHPVLTLKDSLLNTLFERDNSPLFGGCAGHGCGAAFNFVSVLSDGEVHACRKFPSPIGNIISHNLEEVYASCAARRYRAGCSGCSGCGLRAVCGGCMAVTQGMGLDPFNDRDPFCFHHKSA